MNNFGWTSKGTLLAWIREIESKGFFVDLGRWEDKHILLPRLSLDKWMGLWIDMDWYGKDPHTEEKVKKKANPEIPKLVLENYTYATETLTRNLEVHTIQIEKLNGVRYNGCNHGWKAVWRNWKVTVEEWL